MKFLMTDIDVEHNSDSIYTICFTSSSTGQPKGALLSNGNVLANSRCIHLFDANFEVTEDDRYISYLPMAHVLERIMWVACIYHQIRCGFYSGDMAKLTDDMNELKPTLFMSVPRMLNRFNDLI